MVELCAKHPDPSHDILHVDRVVKMAEKIAKAESADLEVVLPAAYLHDCVYISKADPRRSQASTLSADKAVQLLREWNYPEEKLQAVHAAIAAHSFSAGIAAKSLEAQVVQDADRLDAVGAIGIARCFAFSGLALRPLYSEQEPFAETRALNDQANTLDHFFIKLLRLQEKLGTETAKKVGLERMVFLEKYVATLKSELQF
ncbi:MAG: hydrolase [Pseudobdellovibrio sp.]|nr:hydrolase [Pseudobdellovibrio sp.]